MEPNMFASHQHKANVLIIMEYGFRVLVMGNIFKMEMIKSLL